MMPFGHLLAMNLTGIINYFLLLFSVTCVGRVVPAAVKVRDTAIIPCNKTCNEDILWALRTNNEELVVLKCTQGTCKEGNSFKKRAVLNPGKLHLTLYSVLYNDEGWYEVKCGSVIYCKFHLEVIVPSTVNASVRGNVTLPCYARTKKEIVEDDVNILWKKDDQTVLEVQNGVPTYGSGFTGRASVSLQHYKDGDLSLTMLRVSASDSGLYLCYYNTEDHGHPGAVTLNITAHQKVWKKKVGENLTIDLFGTDSVITFTQSKKTETEVCSLRGDNMTCSPNYSNRASVRNYLFMLRGLTSSENGTFTVKDNMGEVISINGVTVESEIGCNSWTYVFIAVSVVAICIGLYFCYRLKDQILSYFRCYAAVRSNVDIDADTPLREPACIGYSQQETNPEPDIRPHTPVEETEPEMTTEKKDSNKEEEFIEQ